MTSATRDTLLVFKLRVTAIIMELTEQVDEAGGSIEDFIKHLGTEVMVLAAHVHREHGGSEQRFVEMARASLRLARDTDRHSLQ